MQCSAPVFCSPRLCSLSLSLWSGCVAVQFCSANRNASDSLHNVVPTEMESFTSCLLFFLRAPSIVSIAYLTINDVV